MMFIGFGFLMTFLKRYGFSSVGLNFLVAAFVLQWATLTGGWIRHFDSEAKKIFVNMETFVSSDDYYFPAMTMGV
jgi:ammonium transporter Rh